MNPELKEILSKIQKQEIPLNNQTNTSNQSGTTLINESWDVLNGTSAGQGNVFRNDSKNTK